MIVEALVSQLEQRFQHEKRAQVCLWFDEKQEFARLLPALRAHLTTKKQPHLMLLEYDAPQNRGQVWLKYRVHQLLSETPYEERKQLRFVLYVPLSEDRLDVPEDDEHTPGSPRGIPGDGSDLARRGKAADPLQLSSPGRRRASRRSGGAAPAVRGRPRTRCSRSTRPSSLTARRSFGRRCSPRSWRNRVSSATWSRRSSTWPWTPTPPGPFSSRADSIWSSAAWCESDTASRRPDGAPADWVHDLVALLALTETYLGYGEPGDFPFSDRLPPLALRPHHTQLLQRWLRDTEYRAAWDRWISTVETKIDLSSWAKSRTGFSFGFPHLVRLRWQAILTAFEEAAPKTSATAEFFERHGQTDRTRGRVCPSEPHSSSAPGTFSETSRPLSAPVLQRRGR